MTIHKLKIKQEYFKEVLACTKTFEVRKNDRNFKTDDIIILREYIDNEYTGLEIWGRIGYILDNNKYLQKGYVAFSFIKASNGFPPKED